MRVLTLCLTMVAFTSRAENPELRKAEQLLSELDYRRAGQQLEAAWARPGNTRDEALRILELQGVVAALLGQDAQAIRLFTALLSLDPARKVEGDYPPRVTTPVATARATAREQGALQLTCVAEPRADGSTSLRARVERDPGRLVRRVRIRWKVDGRTAWERCDGEECVARGTVTQWAAEGLSEFDGVLLEAEGAPPAAPAAPVPGLTTTSTAPTFRLNTPARIASFALAGAGLVALAVGVGVGTAANRERLILVNAARDAEGRITGFGQTEWLARDASQRGLATGANVSFIGAGVAVAVAVVLFIVGGGEPTPMALGPEGLSFDLGLARAQ